MNSIESLKLTFYSIGILLGFCNLTYAQNASQRINNSKSVADLMIVCPSNQTEASCQTQAAIDSKFANWLSSASFTGGCDVSLSNNAGVSPPACGGITTVSFTATSSCDPPVSCTATFSVTNSPAITLNCPANQTETACQTQASIDTKFAIWLSSSSFVGGCNASLSNNNSGAPSACGGSASVQYTVTSSCEAPITCSSLFTVLSAANIVLSCPTNQTEAACQTQASIDSKYASWISSASFTGGCNAMLSNNSSNAPNKCGGIATVQFTVTSSCQAPITCNTVFTVTNATPIILNCPTSKEEAAGQTQAQIDVKFSQWLITAGFTGGCQASLSNDNSGAPPHTGGSTTVIWTVTSACEANVTCNAVFTVKFPSNIEDAQIFENTIVTFDYHSKQALLHLQFEKPKFCNVKIIDINGQILWNKSIHALREKINIDFNEFSKGLYYLELSSGRSKKLFKMLVL